MYKAYLICKRQWTVIQKENKNLKIQEMFMIENSCSFLASGFILLSTACNLSTPLATDSWKTGKMFWGKYPAPSHPFPVPTGICYEKPIGKTGYWAIWAIGHYILTVHKPETVIIGESLLLLATVLQLPSPLNIFINVKNDAVTVASILTDSKDL